MNSYYIYLVIIGGIILTRLPIIGVYVRLINTVIHETGHALTALLFNGEVYRIELFSNSAGTATTSTKCKFFSFLVSLSGYISSSVMAYMLFYMIYHGLEIYILWGITIWFAIILIFFVRNFFGIFWMLSFMGINAYLLYLQNITYIHYVVYIYALIVMIDSVTSTLIAFYLSLIHPSQSGDCYNLQKIAVLPTFIWGLFFLLFSFFMAWHTWQIMNLIG